MSFHEVLLHWKFHSGAVAQVLLSAEYGKGTVRMLADGMLPLEKIAEYAGLSLDEVKKLKAGF